MGYLLKWVCLLHLLSENIFPVLRSNWFYVLINKNGFETSNYVILAYFVFTLGTGYDGRTAERKSDSTWRTWCKQTLRVYHSRRPISWLIPEVQYPSSILHWQAGLWKLDWLRLSIVPIVAVIYVFVYSVVKVLGVQPIICYSGFCSGVLKIQRIEEFSLGFEGNGKFRKKIYSSASCP